MREKKPSIEANAKGSFAVEDLRRQRLREKFRHRYCVACGTDLGEYKVDMKCPNCGYLNE